MRQGGVQDYGPLKTTRDSPLEKGETGSTLITWWALGTSIWIGRET